jgi:hypothetical protein
MCRQLLLCLLEEYASVSASWVWLFNREYFVLQNKSIHKVFPKFQVVVMGKWQGNFIYKLNTQSICWLLVCFESDRNSIVCRGFMVQGSNLGGGKKFSLLLTHSDRPWDPLILIWNRYLGSFTGVKRPGYGFDNHPVLASRLRRGRAICVHTLCAYIGMCTRWPFPLPSLRSRFVQLVTDYWDLWQYLEPFRSCKSIILKPLFDHKFLLRCCVLVQWIRLLRSVSYKLSHGGTTLVAFAKLRKTNVRFVISVCLFEWKTSPPTTGIFMKFYIWKFFENLLRIFMFHYNLTRITGTLHEDQHTYMITFHWILLRVRNTSCEVRRGNQNTHFLFNIFFFRKSCRLWDNVEKYTYDRSILPTDDGVIRRRKDAICMAHNEGKNTNTHSGCFIRIVFPL